MADRMRALEAEFLHVEDGVNHMHIAACAVFEGPCLTTDETEALFRDALTRIPRYRQRVRFVPFDLNRPVWEDDPDFHLDRHVAHAVLPPPGDDEQLCALMAELMATELERDRPLWDAWIVDGVAGGRWALISKVHHCMVDGIAGTGLMEQVLAPEPRPVGPTEDDWTPTPGPSDTRLTVEAAVDALREVPRVAGDLLGLARHPAEAARRARDLGEGVWSIRHELRPGPRTSIEGTIGRGRAWASTEASLDDVRTVRRALGGTVNDVVLTAVAAGFHDLLEARGEDPAEVELRSLIPVSTRVDHDAVDNEVTALFAELPVQVGDPVARLAATSEELDRLKGSHEAELGATVLDLADLAPAPLMAWGSRVAAALLRRTAQRNITTVVTNVPGPQFPLYAAGRRMLAYRPYVPIALGIRVGVAVLSYDGTLFFGLTGDLETAPDVDVLAAGIDRGMAELVDAAAATC